MVISDLACRQKIFDDNTVNGSESTVSDYTSHHIKKFLQHGVDHDREKMDIRMKDCIVETVTDPRHSDHREGLHVAQYPKDLAA